MSTTPSTAHPIEVLIVEDSPTQSLRLQGTLEKHGFRVTAAGNGTIALQTLATLRPTIIVSDIQMPEMDGYELCRHIKADKELKEIPVILLTSLSAPEDIIRGLECGADNFVVKPYEEDFLMARLNSVLANNELRMMDDGNGVQVDFAGRRYVIDANRRQILNLLLSTYETAVQTNQDLIETHEQLKAAQAQLIEAEKMQSVGHLAAGVAHEVRNPLAIMEMGVAILSEQAMPDENRMVLKEMTEAVHRANAVITGLTDLSPRRFGLREVDLHEILERALAAAQAEVTPGKYVLVRAFADVLPTVNLDDGKIEQVFTNVFSNALQAMPEGGTLRITTGLKVLGAGDVAFDAGDRSGVRFREGERAIFVEVRDSGSGVLPEHLGKVFDPFFSTKPTGKGMGLGLTVARKFVDLHNGTITLQNHAEGGAIVTMIFKAA
jgi:signal transduction histidine kinase